MSARTAVSWQTSLADLSLILFMITAAAVTHRVPKPAAEKPVVRREIGPSDRGEALAVYIASPGAPPLARWLSQQPRDPRQQLTITVAYAPGEEAQALEIASRMLREAGTDSVHVGGARIVVEPGSGLPRAELAFDAPAGAASGATSAAAGESMARSLRSSGQASSHGRTAQ